MIVACREETSEYRVNQVLENEAIDIKYGFERVKDHIERTGFLLNMHAVSLDILLYIHVKIKSYIVDRDSG